MRLAPLACLLLSTAVHAQPAPGAKPPAQPSFADALAAAAEPIGVSNGALTGAGGARLGRELATANFVFLGEDHGIAQIPELAGAMCAALAPRGVHRLALEVGPTVGPELTRMASAADGASQHAAFVARYPETVAFYDWPDEFAFLSRCAQATAAAGAPLEIWGLDQELLGSSQLVFERMLATKPGPRTTAAVTALIKRAASARAAAAKAGDFGKLLMLAATGAELARVDKALLTDGTPGAKALFATYQRSRTIYQGQSGPDPYLSNRDRARLMKETFLDDLSAAARADGAFPKVFLKFGAYHGYRGLNPLRSSELGNLIAEAAEGHKVTSLHVIALGVRGQQLAMKAPGVAAPVALDLAHEMPFLAPFFAAQQKTGWTLFDLRPLRSHWKRFGVTDPEVERLVFGYDLLVLVPDPAAQRAKAP